MIPVAKVTGGQGLEVGVVLRVGRRQDDGAGTGEAEQDLLKGIEARRVEVLDDLHYGRGVVTVEPPVPVSEGSFAAASNVLPGPVASGRGAGGHARSPASWLIHPRRRFPRSSRPRGAPGVGVPHRSPGPAPDAPRYPGGRPSRPRSAARRGSPAPRRPLPRGLSTLRLWGRLRRAGRAPRG